MCEVGIKEKKEMKQPAHVARERSLDLGSKNWSLLETGPCHNSCRPAHQTHSTTWYLPMAASAIFVLDQKGKILISRNYRGDVPMSVASRFISKVLEEDETNIKPIIEEEGVSYIFVKCNNLYCILHSIRSVYATREVLVNVFDHL